MKIEELDIEFLSAEVEGYVRALKAFKEGAEFLDKLKALKQLKGDLASDLDALRASLESLEDEAHAAQAGIETARDEAARIVEEADAQADSIIQEAKGAAALLVQEAKKQAEQDKAPVEAEVVALKKQVAEIEGVILSTRNELDDLRKQREDVTSQIKALQEEKENLLKRFQ